MAAFKGERLVRELNEGNSFGESALLYESTRQMTVRAKTEVKKKKLKYLIFYVFIKKYNKSA